jgi:hypothetical protein
MFTLMPDRGAPVRRREVIGFFAGAMAAWPLAMRAQTKHLPLIAYLAAAKQSAISDCR